MESVSNNSAAHNNKTRLGLRAALCLGVGLGALGFAAPAMAQEAEEPVTTNAETTTEANSPRRLNEVVVTVTRREGTTVQDVPIAVTALDAALLDNSNVQRVNDLEQIAPSIQISQGQSSATGTSISIRGIGTGSDNPGFEPAVGVFIDGVYRTKTGVALGDLPELASVEVLRGPQGTLFGRNTSAGALSIRTAGPEREGRQTVSVGLANYGGVSVEGTVTGATGDNSAARLDMKYRRRDGYIEDVNSDREFNNIDRWLARGQFVWEKGDTSLRLIGDVAATDEQCCSSVNLIAGNPANPTVPGGAALAVNGVAAAIGLTGIAAPGNPEAYLTAASPNRDLLEAVDEWGVSAEYNTQIGLGRLTSITAYRSWSVERNMDIDFSGQDRAYREGYFVDDKMFSQEVRLQGETGIVDWLVGAYYLTEELDNTDTIRFETTANQYLDSLSAGALGLQLTGSLGPAVPSLFVSVPNVGPVVRFGFDPNPATSLQISTMFPSFNLPGTAPGDGQQADSFKVDTTAFALFTHNEISLTDKATLTVGLRYNSETKDLEYNLNSIVPTCDFFFTPEGQSVLSQMNAIGAISLAVAACNPTVNSEHNGRGTDSQESNEFTGTLSLAYEVTDDLMVYGGYSRGFKSGGWNLDRGSFDSVLFGGDGAQPSDLEFDPELVDAYELGWKLSFLGGRGTLNGAVFMQEIEGYQFNTFFGTNFVTFNVEAESKGVELDIGYEPVDGLTLQGGYAYTQATYESDPLNAGFIGEQITNIPETVFTGSATYVRPLGSSGVDLLLHGNFRYNDAVEISTEVFRDVNPLPAGGPTSNDAYTLFNARIGIQAADGRWSLSLFGENLTEEYYNLNIFPVPEQTNVYNGYPALPRFYGIEGKISF